MVLLLLDALLQDECRQVAQGATFLIAAFDDCLEGGVGDGNRDPFRRFGEQLHSVVVEGRHLLVCVAYPAWHIAPPAVINLIGTAGASLFTDCI